MCHSGTASMGPSHLPGTRRVAPTMTTTDINCDLDARTSSPTAAQAPRWRRNLPWAIAAVTSAVAVVLFALLIAQPTPVRATPAADAGPTVTATATAPDPTISGESSDGVGSGATVWRDSAGNFLAIMEAVSPYNDEAVWCKLVVNGKAVEVHATDGQPAICVWVRDAA